MADRDAQSRTPEPQAPLLRMAGIWKSFGGVPVLRDVDLDLRAGEVLALLGSNGAGKSTLVKILSGAYTRDRGTVMLDGRPVVFAAPADAVAKGVRLLPQEISVLPDLGIAENIFIGDLPVRHSLGMALVDRGRMRQEARRLLAGLGLEHVDVDRPIKSLSVPEQRVVEIARALAGNARVLVMDEPTAALTEPEAEILFDVIARLKRQQVGIIYISHYLDEVFRVSDRIAVLRDGRHVATFEARAASADAVLTAMLGAAVEDLYPTEAGAPGDVVLEVRRLDVAGALSEAAFDVRKGEIVGIFGLIGSGIGVVGRAVYGALGPLAGADIRLDGRPYTPRDPRHARDLGISFVAAERKREGIIADLTVRENLSMPFIDRFTAGGLVATARETEHVRRWIDRLGIRTQGPEQHIRTLSGGNQQKVCIARWLVEGMKLLILEEPTRGVDVGARKEIYAELRRLTREGLGILVVSSDVEEVAGIADRSLVLDAGRIVGRFPRGTAPAALMAVAAEAAAPPARMEQPA